MALRTIGTVTDLQLACLSNWSQILPPADLAAIGAAISSDAGFVQPIMGTLSPYYVLATGTTAGTTTITGITANVGSPSVGTIRVGDLVLGHAADIVPGTCVTAVAGGGTSVTLSQPAVSSETAALAFLRQKGFMGIGQEAQLWIPGRGMLKVLPGDVVAVDSTGWPILLSRNTLTYSASDWVLT